MRPNQTPSTGPGPRFSAAVFIAQREYWFDRFGEDRVHACLATLGPVGDELRYATAVGWVPFDAVKRAYEALSEATGEPVPALHVATVRASIQRTMKRIWRVFLRFVDDDSMTDRIPTLVRKGYDRGSVRTESGEGHGRLFISDFPGIDDFVVRGLCAATEEMRRTAGRKEPVVRGHTTGPDSAMREGRWK